MTSTRSNAEIIITGDGPLGQRWTREVDPRRYPAGEPLIEHGLVSEWSSAITMLLRPRSIETFVAAMFFVDALTWRRACPVRLVLPAVPGSRQDRLNPTGDYLFTLKSIAKMLNERNFSTVAVIDPHSDVTAALIEKCSVLGADKCINTHFGNRWHGVIAPDAGAAKRAALVGKATGLPVFQAWKKRDVITGALSGFGCEPLDGQGRHFLIVDDICDGGGTFIGLADALRDEYPNITLHLYVTHGYFTKGYDDLLDRFIRIYTTDTVIRDVEPDATDGFIVNPVCGDRLHLP